MTSSDAACYWCLVRKITCLYRMLVYGLGYVTYYLQINTYICRLNLLNLMILNVSKKGISNNSSILLNTNTCICQSQRGAMNSGLLETNHKFFVTCAQNDVGNSYTMLKDSNKFKNLLSIYVFAQQNFLIFFRRKVRVYFILYATYCYS